MIYLIDDKKRRQNEFGWSDDKLSTYTGLLVPLYNIDDIASVGDALYDKKNIILYHESFLDFTANNHKAVGQRKKLFEKAENNEITVAFFSGSQSSKSLVDNAAYIPVSVLYENLECYIKNYNQGLTDLKYLLFGESPEIESDLEEKRAQSNTDIEDEAAEIQGKNLFIRPARRFIENAIEGAKEEIITINDISDDGLSSKINDWLGETQYDHIFIPLCFGPTLSDFNGLRLAAHIRCTPSPNQLTRIFVYGFVGLDYLMGHEYFNILKTKNVQLIPYSKRAFTEAVNTDFQALKMEELPQEITKLKLDLPLNYADSHSIANEWAIHQWAKTIGCDETDEIEKIFKTAESNLYFKYLRTINPVSEVDKISPQELKINFKGNPKVLLIDDEAEKGWYEIFAYLLGDENEVYTDYLGDDFKTQSQEDIIDKSIKKIKDDDIDVVILDFRLNPNDFIGSNPKDISSIRLLKKIKELNPGIQVIIFSATNKVWNLQPLQAAGADGFILKGSPKYSVESEFISKSITSFINEFQKATRKLFLKDFYKLLFQVENSIKACDYEDESEYEGFLNDLRSQITIISQSGKNVDTEISTTLDVVFLNCFNFIEKFKNYYFYLGIERVPLHRYDYKKARIIDRGEFRRDGSNDQPSWFQSIVGLLVDYFDAIDNKDPLIKNLHQIKNSRNNYIHNKKSYFSQSDILKISDLMSKLTSSMKE